MTPSNRKEKMEAKNEAPQRAHGPHYDRRKPHSSAVRLLFSRSAAASAANPGTPI